MHYAYAFGHTWVCCFHFQSYIGETKRDFLRLSLAWSWSLAAYTHERMKYFIHVPMYDFFLTVSLSRYFFKQCHLLYVCSACTPFSPPTHRGLAYKTFATFVLLIMTDHRWPTSSVTWIFRVKMKHNACSYSLFSCFQHICCRIAIFGQNSRTWLNMLKNSAELGVIVDFLQDFWIKPYFVTCQ